MSAFSKVTITGRVSRVSKSSTEGKTQCFITIPETTYFNGETKTLWHNIGVFGSMVESTLKNVHKGTIIAVEASISYTKLDERRHLTYFNATKITYIDKFGPQADTEEQDETAE